jgi:ribose 5-phosphate isomerase B
MFKGAVVIASDHAGFDLRTELRDWLVEEGVAVTDLGTDSRASVDYPDFADAVAQALKDGRAVRGILVCGTGIGISIAANRHRHVRAALCHDVTTARLSREHNDANVIAMGARTMGIETAKDCVTTFLTTAFSGGERHGRRVAKLG